MSSSSLSSSSSSSFFNQQQQQQKDSFTTINNKFVINDAKNYVGRCNYFSSSINNNHNNNNNNSNSNNPPNNNIMATSRSSSSSSSPNFFSSLSAVMDHQDHHHDNNNCSDNNDHQNNNIHHYYNYNATTTNNNNGKTVTLHIIKHQDYNNNETEEEEEEDHQDQQHKQELTFHASWLWINDPKNVHPTSFQKIRSLGQYPGCFVSYARVITDSSDEDDEDEDHDSIESSNNSNNNNNNNNNINMLNINLINFPKSPSRYLHSRGGIYNDDNNNIDNHHRTMLQIFWDTGDESFYDIDWLLRCRSIATTTTTNNDSATTISDFLERTKVTKDVAIGSLKSNDIQRLDYSFVMNNDEEEEGKFQALHEIMEHGAVLIQNAPSPSTTSNNNNNGNNQKDNQQEYIVAELGRHLTGSGQLSHGSLYGDVFHVQSMSDANNIAYTNEQLPPHQDLTYYESKPFLQLLHCVHDHTKVIGGESVLVDAMAAAEYLRELSPDLFDVLTKVPCTFVKQRDGADMVSCKPIIVVDNVYNQVVTVNWSPPFEGPLLHLPSNITMEEYVSAYQAMECMLNNNTLSTTTTTTTTTTNSSTSNSSSPSSLMLLPESIEKACREYSKSYTWEYALKKNEILVFNNQRMVHARRGFDVINPTINKRHLIGCYTDAMDTISSYRICLRQRLQRQQQQQRQASNDHCDEIIGIRNAGNGYLGI